MPERVRNSPVSGSQAGSVIVTGEDSRADTLISIVIPVHNAAWVLAETVASVRAQTYTDWELILVEDHSTDESLAVAESLADEYAEEKLRVIRNTGEAGAAHARNLGIEAVKGRYLAYLDADDLWEREKLEKQLAFLREKDAAFTFTGYEFADENGRGLGRIVRVPETISYRQALKNTTIFTSTVMFDLTKLSKAEIRMPAVESEDTACWWKLLRGGAVAFGLNEPLTLYRRSAGTLSSSKFTAVRRIWNLYRNVEGLPVFYSVFCFAGWAFRAVKRRLG
ncbi:MAG: glycosyltransferase family 2 protein [Lachnospiraceae bacterium]|nr:glycosyltransferase family 2 protein [Lachnospiraceae bacterium]